MSEPCKENHSYCMVRLKTDERYVTAKRIPRNGGEIKLLVGDSQYEGKPLFLLTCERTKKYMAFSFEDESGCYHLRNDGENLKLEKSADPLSCSANLLFEKEDVGGGEEHCLKAEDKRLCLGSRNILKLSTTEFVLFSTEELTNS